jgi:hypothetical protein
MAGRATTSQGRKLGNINNMPNRRYLPSINFSVPLARWSHFMSLLTGLLCLNEETFRLEASVLPKILFSPDVPVSREVPGGLYLKSFAKLRVRKSATCEWYCERSLSDMRNTIRMLLICAHATLRMTSNKAPLLHRCQYQLNGLFYSSKPYFLQCSLMPPYRFSVSMPL